jgi:hypothetical protein
VRFRPLLLPPPSLVSRERCVVRWLRSSSSPRCVSLLRLWKALMQMNSATMTMSVKTKERRQEHCQLLDAVLSGCGALGFCFSSSHSAGLRSLHSDFRWRWHRHWHQQWRCGRRAGETIERSGRCTRTGVLGVVGRLVVGTTPPPLRLHTREHLFARQALRAHPVHPQTLLPGAWASLSGAVSRQREGERPHPRERARYGEQLVEGRARTTATHAACLLILWLLLGEERLHARYCHCYLEVVADASAE